jgi:dUTP pyrophosphatase
MVQVEYVMLDSGAHPPERMTEGSAGFDLRACVSAPLEIESGRVILVPTGLALAIPPGYEGQLRPRSGLAMKYGVTLANSPGTIDCDYRGPVGILLVNHGKASFLVNSGDRIAQLVIAPVTAAVFERVESLDVTSRGAGGFGHTGR